MATQAGQGLDVTADIYNLAIECGVILDSLSERAKLKHGKKFKRMTLEDKSNSSKLDTAEIERSFNAWIDNTGALADDPSKSLDTRLHAHRDIQKMVVDLLKMLVRNLGYRKAAFRVCAASKSSNTLTMNFSVDNPDSVKPNGPSDNNGYEDNLEDEASNGIQQALEGLYFMARAILRASVRSHEYSLSPHFHRDDDSYFQEQACLFVRHSFKDARRSLCNQLGASLAIRRSKFLQRMRHEEKPVVVSDRDHLEDDTEHYVCLSEGCISPLLFFVDMEDWMSHMVTFHSVEWHRKIHMSTWYCDVSHEAVLQFNDYGSFVRHVRDPPTDLQLDTLSRTSTRFLIRDEEYCCPLCECVPDILEPVIASSDPDKIRRSLHEHIAAHLKDLPFETIPALEEAEPSEDTQYEVNDDSHRRLLGGDSMASYPSGLHELRQETSLAFEDGFDRGSGATEITDLVCMWNRSIIEEEWEEGEGIETWEEWKEWEYKAAIGLPRQDPILDHFARTQRQTIQVRGGGDEDEATSGEHHDALVESANPKTKPSSPIQLPHRPSRPQSRLSEADTLIVEHGEGRLFDTTDFVDQEE
ncbi:hypothetical protein ACHAPE_003925 [Trichoderma viride]